MYLIRSLSLAALRPCLTPMVENDTEVTLERNLKTESYAKDKYPWWCRWPLLCMWP